MPPGSGAQSLSHWPVREVQTFALPRTWDLWVPRCLFPASFLPDLGTAVWAGDEAAVFDYEPPRLRGNQPAPESRVDRGGLRWASSQGGDHFLGALREKEMPACWHHTVRIDFPESRATLVYKPDARLTAASATASAP